MSLSPESTSNSMMPEPESFLKRLSRMLSVIVTGAIGLGVVSHLVTYHEGPLFFPTVVIGLGAAFVISYAIWWGKLHNVLVSIILALLLVILIYGSFQITRYLVFRNDTAAAIAQESTAPLDWQEANRRVDDLLVDHTGLAGFMGFIAYQLNAGMIISNGPEPLGLVQHLTGSNLLAYWLLDIGFILLGAGAGVWIALRRSFCPYCHAYYGHIRLTVGNFGLESLGWIDGNSGEVFLQSLGAEHFEQAGNMLITAKSQFPVFNVLVERCPTCNNMPVFLSVFYQHNRFTTPTLVSRDKLTPEQFERLLTFTSPDKLKQPAKLNRWFVAMILVFFFLFGLFVLSVLAYNAF